MKKNKFTALITAGCFAFVATSAADAKDWGDFTFDSGTTSLTTAGDDTFDTIKADTEGTYTINANNGYLKPSTKSGTVTLGNNANITITGTKDVLFDKLEVGGTSTVDNTISASGKGFSSTRVDFTGTSSQLTTKGNQTLSTIYVNDNAASSRVGSLVTASPTGEGAAATTTTFNTATVGANDTLNLTANANTIIKNDGTTNDIRLSGNLNLDGAGKIAINKVSVQEGVNASISNSNSNTDTKIGTIGVAKNAAVNLTGLSSGTDYNTLTLGENVSLKLNNSQIGDHNVAQNDTLTIYGSSETGTSSFNNITMTAGAAEPAGTTTLNLNIEKSNLTGNKVTMQGNSLLKTDKTESAPTDKTVNLAEIAASGTNNTVTANNALNVTKISVNNGGIYTNGSANIAVGSTDASVTEQGISLTNSTLNVGGLGQFSNTKVNVVSGTNTIRNSYDTENKSNANFGAIELNGGTLNLEYVSAANHEGINFANDATLGLNNSHAADFDVAAGKTATINTIAGANTFGEVALNDASTLNLNNTAQATTLSGKTIILTGNNNITTSGQVTLGTDTASAVIVDGSGNTITNTNANTNLSLNGVRLNHEAEIELVGVTFADGQKISVGTGATANGTGTITLDNTKNAQILVGAGQDVNLIAENSPTYKSVEFTAGTAAKSSILNVDTTASSIAPAADSTIDMKGNNSIVVKGSQTNTFNAGTVNIEGTNNVLQADNGNITYNTLDVKNGAAVTLDAKTAGDSISGVANSEIKLAGSTLTTQGAGKVTTGAISVSGAGNTINQSTTTTLGQITLNGAGAELEMNGGSATGNDNIISAGTNQDLTLNGGKTPNVTLNSGSSLQINDKVASALGIVTLNQGTTDRITSLTLNNTNGAMSVNRLDMNGSNSVVANNTNKAVTVGTLNVANTNNTVDLNNLATDTSLGNIVLTNGSAINIDGLSDSNYTKFTVAEGVNTTISLTGASLSSGVNIEGAGNAEVINSGTSNYGDINISGQDRTYTSGGTTAQDKITFTSATVENGSLTLNVLEGSPSSIEGTGNLTLNGNAAIGFNNGSRVSINNGNIVAAGAANTLTNTDSSNALNINGIIENGKKGIIFSDTSTSNELTLNGDFNINNADINAGSVNDKLISNGTNTVSGTAFVNGGNKLTIEAKSNTSDVVDTFTFNSANVVGSELTLDANGGNIVVNNASSVLANTTSEPNVAGTLNINGSNDVTFNNGLNVVNSNLNINGSGTNNTFNLGALAANGATIGIAGTGNVVMNGIQSTNSTLAVTGNNAVNTGNVALENSTFTVRDNTQIGNLTVTGSNTMNVTGTHSVNVGKLTINDNAALSTSNGLAETITATGAEFGENATWQLNAVASTGNTNVELDKLVISGADANTGKLDFEITDAITVAATPKFVKYVQIADVKDAEGNQVGILNTTYKDATAPQLGNNILVDNLYYSYVDPSETVAGEGSYAANTIRVTNYNIGSDHLTDYITRQGDRVHGIAGGPQYIAATGVPIELPNLEVRAGVENILTLNGLYEEVAGAAILDASDGTDETHIKMFTVDTSEDNIERTLNLNGIASYQNAVAVDNGAILDVKSGMDETTSAASTVNVNALQVLENVVVHPTFRDNVAAGNGGVVNADGLKAVVNFGNNRQTDFVFENNVAGAGTTAGNGGVIANTNGAKINFAADSKSTFRNNTAYGHGGAIYNYDTLDADSTRAAAEVVVGGSEINFVNNKALSKTITDDAGEEIVVGGYGGAIYNEGATVKVGNDNSVVKFSGNSAVNGGAIASVNNAFTVTGDVTFNDNTASNLGGAIYAKGANIDLISTKKIEFTGNTAAGESNAIYLDGDATINLQSQNDGTFVFNDKIAGTNANNNIVQHNGSAYYNNDNSGYAGNFSLLGGDAYFNQTPEARAFAGGDYTLAGGSTLHLDNNRIDVIKANSLTLTGDTPAQMTIDMDLTNEVADRFELNNSTSGQLLVTGIKTQGDTQKEKIFYDIADGAQVDSTQKEVESSLFVYDVMGRPNGLLLQKNRFADTGIFAPQVAVNARVANQLATYDQLLHRVDEIAEYRYFNKVDRHNLYASAHDVIDNKYTPYVNQEDGGNTWVKPSFTIETINPTGPVSYKNRAYNTILGYETPISTLKNGWEIINTVFGGYQGSFQDYDNIRNYQNGGVGGYMANLYKKNFFAGGVVMMGGANVDVKDSGKYNRNMNFGLFDVGAAARVGYNVGMGKNWLFQPMFTASYLYITGLDRHNTRGETMDLDGTNTIQIAPGFKIVGNYNGWQPYLLFDYTWPIMAKTVANVNNIDLPDVGLRSYVEYGVGLRKNFGERFTGQAEAVMRNGGRTGVSLQGAFVYRF